MSGSIVHERMVVANPLDYQMFDWNDEDRLAETFSAFVTDDFDVSLCLLDYPRADKCDPRPGMGPSKGFIRAAKQTGARTAVLSTFTDTMPEPLAERLIEKGIVPLAGIDTGLAGIQAAVDVGAAWSRTPAPPLLESVGPAGGRRRSRSWTRRNPRASWASTVSRCPIRGLLATPRGGRGGGGDRFPGRRQSAGRRPQDRGRWCQARPRRVRTAVSAAVDGDVGSRRVVSWSRRWSMESWPSSSSVWPGTSSSAPI